MRQALGYYVRILSEHEDGLEMFLEAYQQNQDIRCYLMHDIEVIREDYFSDLINDDSEEITEGYQNQFNYMTIEQIEEVAEK